MAQVNVSCGARLLVVEDNSVDQMLVMALLEKQGHRVTVVQNGAKAIHALERRDFDLVLMDVQMPEMDGIEATRRIRAMEAGGGRRIPIIAMTAHAMTGDRERCLEAGMDAFLSKPIDTKELESAVFRLIGGVLADLDAEDALRMVGGDAQVLARLSVVFARVGPERLLVIRAGVEAGDAKIVAITAHGLRGAALSLAMPRLSEIAERIEVLAARGALDEAAPLIDELEAAVAVAMEQLKAATK